MSASPFPLFAELAPEWEAADPTAERLIEGTPTASITTLFASVDGSVAAGTWRSSPGRWRVLYDETEYCRILEGEGAVIDDQGRVCEIGPGDEFMVPAGFRGEWLVRTPMTKRYVVIL